MDPLTSIHPAVGWIIAIAIALTTLAAAWKAVIGPAVRRLAATARQIAHFFDDWYGTLDDDHPDGKAGVIARLDVIEGEVTHNHGSSLKDSVRRTEQAVEQANLSVTDLTRNLAAHIDEARRRDERIDDLYADVSRLPCDQCGHLHRGDPHPTD